MNSHNDFSKSTGGDFFGTRVDEDDGIREVRPAKKNEFDFHLRSLISLTSVLVRHRYRLVRERTASPGLSTRTLIS